MNDWGLSENLPHGLDSAMMIWLMPFKAGGRKSGEHSFNEFHYFEDRLMYSRNSPQLPEPSGNFR